MAEPFVNSLPQEASTHCATKNLKEMSKNHPLFLVC